MSARKRVVLLGATGSIGVNTLDVIGHARKCYGAGVLPVAPHVP